MAAKTDKAGAEVSALFIMYAYNAGGRNVRNEYKYTVYYCRQSFGHLEIQSILYTVYLL